MICKNPECGKDIEHRKSAKRTYCDDRCKNRAAYIRRHEKEGHLMGIDKKIKSNYRILAGLKEKELGPINMQTLLSHGFDLDFLHKDKHVKLDNGKNQTASGVYDILFIINDKNQLIFI